jgi:REP element-mobilizing transposase RayT
MPRQARLDAPGTLHHVIIRGIERKEIVKDDHDRQNFVYRMVTIALETGTLIYAWALMTNHAHIFFCAALHPVFPGICTACYRVMLFHITVAIAGTGIPPKADLRLFQNRYKSIICSGESCKVGPL